jgi:NDP-sugar pyrophosphorylase family protein
MEHRGSSAEIRDHRRGWFRLNRCVCSPRYQCKYGKRPGGSLGTSLGTRTAMPQSTERDMKDYSNVQVGAGSYIGLLCVTSVNAKIGPDVIIDMHASIGHDAVLKDFCAVYPGARISGCCCVGEYVLFGSNATNDLPQEFVMLVQKN